MVSENTNRTTNNRTAIFKTRTNERTLPMVKKNQKNVPEENQKYQGDYYDNLNNGFVSLPVKKCDVTISVKLITRKRIITCFCLPTLFNRISF